MSTQDLIEQVTVKANEDASFLEQLWENPREAIASLTGVTLGDEVSVDVIDEGDGSISLEIKSDELSEDELDAVAGGGGGLVRPQ